MKVLDACSVGFFVSKTLFLRPYSVIIMAFTCSKSTMETPDQCVKFVQG